MRGRRQVLSAGLAAAASGLAGRAWAEEKYPSRPLRVIVPLPAGGVADTAARLIGQVMQPGYGQPVVIENKPGGVYQIGVNALVQAPADGYTLLYVNAGMLPAQALFKRFDMFKQMQALVGIGETDVAITASGRTGFKSIKELIAYGRANPGKLSYATSGAGSGEHLALTLFCKAYGIEAVHVPMRGGPDVAKALMQKEVDLGAVIVPFLLQFAADGRLHPLVLLNDRRNAALPDLPTFKEEQLRISRLTLWGGFAAAAGTPPGVLAHLEQLLIGAARHPEVQKRFLEMGMVSQSLGIQEFGRLWHDDYAWISRAAGEVKVEMLAN